MDILRFLKNENFVKIYWSCNFEGFFYQVPLRSHECFFIYWYYTRNATEFLKKPHVTIMAPIVVSSQKHQKIKFWSTLRAFEAAVTSFQSLKLFVFESSIIVQYKRPHSRKKNLGSGHKWAFFNIWKWKVSACLAFPCGAISKARQVS